MPRSLAKESLIDPLIAFVLPGVSHSQKRMGKVFAETV
jgi:hypothetical protein